MNEKVKQLRQHGSIGHGGIRYWKPRDVPTDQWDGTFAEKRMIIVTELIGADDWIEMPDGVWVQFPANALMIDHCVEPQMWKWQHESFPGTQEGHAYPMCQVAKTRPEA